MTRIARIILWAPAATIALFASQVSAQDFIVWTCVSETSWTMNQPRQHYDEGFFPSWIDCEAWREGDPGELYVWSYGLSSTPPTTSTSSTTTTSTSTTSTSTTTTTVPDTTTTSTSVPETTTNSTSTTTPPTTTTTSTSLPEPPPATSTTSTSTTTTTTIPDTTTTSSTSIAEQPTPQDPRPAASNVNTKAFAPGVTPEQATVVVLSTITSLIFPTPKKAKP